MTACEGIHSSQMQAVSDESKADLPHNWLTLQRRLCCECPLTVWQAMCSARSFLDTLLKQRCPISTWSRLGVDVSIHSMSAYGAYARPRAMQDCRQHSAIGQGSNMPPAGIRRQSRWGASLLLHAEQMLRKPKWHMYITACALQMVAIGMTAAKSRKKPATLSNVFLCKGNYSSAAILLRAGVNPVATTGRVREQNEGMADVRTRSRTRGLVLRLVFSDAPRRRCGP